MSGLELDAVASILEPRIYPRGSMVFSEGEGGAEMFIVHTGKIGMTSIDGNGECHECKPFGPKAFFGEMSLIEGIARSETCTALEDTKLLVLSGINFLQMVWDTPMLGVKFLKAMARIKIERLSQSSGFLEDMVQWGEIARRRAVTDDLSGLFNRRFIEEAVRSRFCRGFGESRQCSLLMIDFDRFRDINMVYGAIAGDAVISNAGATIQRVVGDKRIASRLSGDEFAIFLPDSGTNEAIDLARSIQAEIAQLFLIFRTKPDIQPDRINLTLSIGVASCPNDAQTQTDLFHAADRALYRAKEEGRNRVCTSSDET